MGPNARTASPRGEPPAKRCRARGSIAQELGHNTSSSSSSCGEHAAVVAAAAAAVRTSEEECAMAALAAMRISALRAEVELFSAPAMKRELGALYGMLAVSQHNQRKACQILRILDLTRESEDTHGFHGYPQQVCIPVESMGTDGMCSWTPWMDTHACRAPWNPSLSTDYVAFKEAAAGHRRHHRPNAGTIPTLMMVWHLVARAGYIRLSLS